MAFGGVTFDCELDINKGMFTATEIKPLFPVHT